MKIRFHTLGLSLNANLRRWLAQPLERLRSRISVAAAAVVLEQRRGEAPAFRAFVSLAVPGPDIHSEARDHTLEAVWRKVTTALCKQIELRKTCQQHRHKVPRQHRLMAGRWSGAPSGGRV